MQVGIVGLPFSGKTTIFNALTHGHAKMGEFAHPPKELNRAKIKIPDDRVHNLAKLYNPKKVTPAEVEYIDVGGLVKSLSAKDGSAYGGKEKTSESEFLAHLRDVDLLAFVVRVFEDENVIHPSGSINPKRDIDDFEVESVVIDLDQIEKRMKRLEKTLASSKLEQDKRELDLLIKCKEALNKGIPLRNLDLTSEEEKLLRGYSFLSLKPLLVILNIGEVDIKNMETLENEIKPSLKYQKTKATSLCGKLEMELAQLEEKDKKDFMQELGLTQSALDKMIDLSYKLLGLLSFFTCNENEVRAWTIPKGTVALKAAGVVHTDMEKGFIKADVINYSKLMEFGSTHKAKEKGELRLEAKDYVVKDGDVIFFRFSA